MKERPPFASILREGLENMNHMVVAPRGGLMCSINDLLFGFAEYLILELDYNGTSSSIKVTPRVDEITEDPERRGVYYFNDNVGVFLDETGNETGNTVNLFVMINTEVTTEGMPIGTLRMWLQDPIHTASKENHEHQ